MKKEFSFAQEKWTDTVMAEGSIAQAGGWDMENGNEACIISFWKGKEYLDDFMKNLHDKIFSNNKQANTYSKININYYDSLFNMDGEVGSLTEAVKQSSILRTADCFIKPDKAGHFEKTQREIWSPGMFESKGMLNRVLSKQNNIKYLVSTFLDSIENHTNYVKNKLPGFQIKTGVENDIVKIFMRKILLVDSWKVIKNIDA